MVLDALRQPFSAVDAATVAVIVAVTVAVYGEFVAYNSKTIF